MGTREILTLQFGQYSNFIGTHWWNLQEAGFTYKSDDISEINHDTLYREGVSPRREVTFTPRLLSVDLRDGLKALPEVGELYGGLQLPSTSELNWNENAVEVKKEDCDDKSQFLKDLAGASNVEEVLNKDYDFERDVTVWSDYLYSRFHPRTVNVVKQFEYGNVNTPFDVFPLGKEVWKTEQFEEDFTDKIRNYVEECDSFQGFHMLTDCTNAFAGMSSSCLEYLQDEYERKSVLVFPVIPSHFPDNDYETEKERQDSLMSDSIRLMNLALSYNAYNEFSSLFIPLCTSEKGFRQPGLKRSFHNTEYNHKLPYHSSAILASALDTFTLKHRLKTSGFNLVDLCVDLNMVGRKCASASLCFPFCINKNVDLIDCLDQWDGPLTKSITPSCEIGTDRQMQHITIRGIPESRLKGPPHNAEKQRDLPAFKCKTVSEMLTFYYQCTQYASATNVTSVQKALPVKTPFPKFFNQKLDFTGNFTNSEQLSKPESIPVLAGLHTGAEIGVMLEKLHTETRKIKFKRFNAFISGGIENDDFEECLDNIFTLRENYEDNYFL
ncbi:unnamed protein product [Brassicogethes aeneus]|uniref:Protein misato n=1 Tax=Brassicogethes aeneus TaxID=1431903 RepID=A0A9P0B680_BRAAE|nr:unnamed protein product [Brassicogethes aeneus]